MQVSRRNLLVGGGAASLVAPRLPRAAAGSSERRFIFVQALGAWDVTQVFAPVFGSPGIVHQTGCEPSSLGDLSWVDHRERPHVSRFFARFADQTALINGVYVASIAHPSALRLSLTSSLDATQADWATRIGAFSTSDSVTPHLVVGGCYYAGRYGVHVGRGSTSGQLQALDEQIDVAIMALENGVARCVTVGDSLLDYDSHAVNDELQSPLFNSLFLSLETLMDRLAAATSPSGASLADETVVVVLSEMARSPTYNGSNGRDHWPCTSVMIVGSGVAGGRVYGGWDSLMYGQPVDLASGDIAEGGTWLAPEHVGATLLALADVDPADTGLSVGPIGAVLA